MKKVECTVILYNHDEKVKQTIKTPGYEFEATMKDGNTMTCHVMKSGETWQVIDATYSILLGKWYGTRKRAIEDTTRKVNNAMTKELFDTQGKKMFEHYQDYKEGTLL